jgi:hypothetical protein
MKYARQLQGAINDLDQKLLALNRIIKRGQVEEAIQYMEQGPLKDSFENLQNIYNIAQTGNLGDGLGARGTTQTGTL